MVAIFASCSNDANGASDDNKDKGVIVTIRLDRATMTRVMGDPNATDANSYRYDTKIDKVGFLIFDAAGNLVTRHNDVFEENKVYRFSTTDDAHEMYIVTNVDANILREVNKITDLTNKAIISLKENDYSAIPMIGQTIACTCGCEKHQREHSFGRIVHSKRDLRLPCQRQACFARWRIGNTMGRIFLF